MEYITRKPRILALGNAVKPTGFARVFHSLFARLHHSFEIIQFGIDYYGPALHDEWIIEPNRLPGDIFGLEQLPGLLKKYQPRLILILYDYWLAEVHQKTLDEYHLPHQVVFYCPVESGFNDSERIRALAGVDHLVLFCRYAGEAIRAEYQYYQQEGNSRPLPPIRIIPHGVDKHRFFPISGVSGLTGFDECHQAARPKLFPDRPELMDAFIVLNANRNCPRKRMDLTLKAFAEFARHNPPHVYLYLHMGMRDTGIDILKLARELGIESRLLLTTRLPEKPAVSDEQLNLIYNACDVGINTSTGEGWGLVALEHAAAGGAQIVPNNSASAEIWNDAGLVIPLEPGGPDGTEQLISIDKTAHCLNQLFTDRALLRHYTLKAYQKALSPALDWDNIALQWADFFASIIPGTDQ